MIKEELEKEAEISSNTILGYESSYYVSGYIDGAEPREKQIQIDAEQILALQKQNGELTDELKALRESVKNYGAECYENGLRNGRRSNKLTEAKEIIRELLNYDIILIDSTRKFEYMDLQKKAESFLEEVENA